MRSLLFLFTLTGAAALAPTTRAADPITVRLHERATVGTTVVTVGDVALVSGGDDATRARIAGTDVADLKARAPSTSVGRRAVEYRLLLAGFEPSALRVTGAERTTIALARRTVTIEEVTAAARAEVLRQFAAPADVTIELAVPVVVKLPEVPADERVAIGAKLHGRPGATGRVQVDVTIGAGGETLLSFAMYLDVRAPARPGAPNNRATGPVAPTSAPPATTPVGTEILIQPRQRVEMQVRSGGLKVSAVGEAQQAGKLGQTILVQNVDSKKVLSGRVTGPGTVEIDLGGAP